MGWFSKVKGTFGGYIFLDYANGTKGCEGDKPPTVLARTTF